MNEQPTEPAGSAEEPADDNLVEAARRRRKRDEFWRAHGERSLAENLAMIGALGWLIVTPTLIMRGDRDSLAPEGLVEELHSGIKGSRLVEFKGGHIFFLWKNQEFTEAVTDFLRGLG